MQQAMTTLLHWQRELHRSLAQALGGGNGQLLLAAGLSIGLGAVHALTPGHGKTVIAAYALGSGGLAWRGWAVAVGAAGFHIGVSAAMFSALYWVWTASSASLMGRNPALGAVSGVAVLAIGLWLAVRAAWGMAGPGVTDAQGGTNDRSHAGEGSRGLAWATGITAGMVPCPLTIAILFFSVEAGLLGAVAVTLLGMFLGVAATLTVVWLAVALFRAPLAAWLARNPTAYRLGIGALGLLSGLVLAGIGAASLFSALLLD